ncbi:MAG: hypothetical protein L0271_18915 [Gemmatimonadetes bacterium]|nr:hypothetical protein [Gemmatimonadota bacterium]
MNIGKLKFALAASLMLGATQAYAVGTDAGTDISNTATVDYTVGGVNQPDVSSNTVTFETDRRINLTVAETGGAYTNVAPGETARVLTFTVTNSTNAAADFRLIATQDATGTSDPFGGTDDFDATNVQIFADSNANGTYDPGVDTVTFLDEVLEDATRVVFIVADIPLGQANNDSASFTLTAVAAESGTAGTLGADSTETAGAETATVVDTVFGDVAGDTDAARDGLHSDDDAYRILTATLTVTKIAVVFSDPFNGTTNPKRIPGAVVVYCIAVQNTGTAAASDVIVTDVLTGQPVTYVAASLITTNGGAACSGGSAEDDDAAGADETDPNGASFAGDTVTVTFPALPAGVTKSGRFRVTIN